MELKYIKDQFDVSQFLGEIGELKNKISGAKHENGVLTIYLSQELTEGENPQLATFVTNHVANFIPGIVSKTVQQNKTFADNMMQTLKKKNILEGLSSIDQAAWIHHKLRKMDYTLGDGETVVQLDILNLVVSGDIETAEHALTQMAPDDMTEPYHWLNQERIDWIRNEIRSYLGWPLI